MGTVPFAHALEGKPPQPQQFCPHEETQGNLGWLQAWLSREKGWWQHKTEPDRHPRRGARAGQVRGSSDRSGSGLLVTGTQAHVRARVHTHTDDDSLPSITSAWPGQRPARGGPPEKTPFPSLYPTVARGGLRGLSVAPKPSRAETWVARCSARTVRGMGWACSLTQPALRTTAQLDRAATCRWAGESSEREC